MKRRTKFFVALAAVAILALGGVAYAVWSADGSGSGKAKALTAVTVDVNAATGTADLYPGATNGDIHFTLDNANPYPITFDSFSAGTITSSDQANCPASLVTVDDSGSISVSVAASTNGTAGTIADVVSLDSTAGDGCQGVTFTIALTLSGSQV